MNTREKSWVSILAMCRIMKQQGHVVDEVVCFILLRLCFNCLRNAWLPGGYPPKKDAIKGMHTRQPSPSPVLTWAGCCSASHFNIAVPSEVPSNADVKVGRTQHGWHWEHSVAFAAGLTCLAAACRHSCRYRTSLRGPRCCMRWATG